MASGTRLDEMLRSLGGPSSNGLPADFMDGVWQRAGELAEARNGRKRVALFCAVFVAALGSGYWTVNAPAERDATYEFASALELSPAGLLHAES